MIILPMAIMLLAGGILLPSVAQAKQAEHILLVVLEGVGPDAIQSGLMPHLQQLAKEGATAQTALSNSPPLSVPSMATLLTGLPVEKHRISSEWENYDFSRSFLRAPTVFDYLDLAGGLDTALFLMDERFYQLSRPEIYVDSQMCGKAKPECNPQTIVSYVRDYLTKVTNEGGHGFRLFTVPALLVTHIPHPAHIAHKRGWGTKAYRQALKDVDGAIGQLLDIYRDFGVLEDTMVLVTGLNGGSLSQQVGDQSSKAPSTFNPVHVPWIASGANIKPGHLIQQTISIQDTAATIMEALGLETHTEWESHAITEIFQTTPERRTTEKPL